MPEKNRSIRRVVSVGTHEAKSRLSSLLKLVEESDAVVQVCRNGVPVAELRRISRSPDPLTADPVLSKVVFNEDPSLPATDEDWPEKSR